MFVLLPVQDLPSKRETTYGPTSKQGRSMAQQDFYLSLIVGNTRLHWAQVKDDDRGHVMQRWDSTHLSAQSGAGEAAALLKDYFPIEVWQSLFQGPAEEDIGHAGNKITNTWPTTVPLYLASVVPEQTRLWSLVCPHVKVLESRMCLAGLEQYPTLGVDRALSVRGASAVYGWPVMVVDGGTALTFTRGDETDGGCMKGGAILPGIRVQFETLRGRTALLPLVSLPPLDSPLPSCRWAMSTPAAIQSGVAHAAVAAVEDFSRDFWTHEPRGAVVLTGGDAEWLHACLQTRGTQRKHAGWGPGETDSAQEEKEGPRWVVNNDVAHHGLHWVVRRLRGQRG